MPYGIIDLTSDQTVVGSNATASVKRLPGKQSGPPGAPEVGVYYYYPPYIWGKPALLAGFLSVVQIGAITVQFRCK
jgi:hypothetical protein